MSTIYNKLYFPLQRTGIFARTNNKYEFVLDLHLYDRRNYRAHLPLSFPDALLPSPYHNGKSDAQEISFLTRVRAFANLFRLRCTSFGLTATTTDKVVAFGVEDDEIMVRDGESTTMMRCYTRMEHEEREATCRWR